jgi:hypothetical protein
MGCDEGPQFDNPLDPDNNPDYVVPETYIITDIDGMTFDTSYVQVVISGNELVSEYSYTLDSLVWSDWSTDDTLNFNYLDEGEYTLHVKSRYLSGEEDSEPVSASFIIDAVQGPGLRIFPIYSEFDAGESESVQLYLESVENISFGEIVLNLKSSASCNSNILASKGSLLTNNNGETVLISEEFEENILGDVFASYKITFGISQDEGIGLSGTGSVANLQISYCGDPIEIQFDLENSKLLDYQNNEIPLIDSGVGIIE